MRKFRRSQAVVQDVVKKAINAVKAFLLLCGFVAIGFLPVTTSAAAAKAQKDQKATVEDFARPPEFFTAKISPDGRYVAVTYWHKDVFALSIIKLADLRATATLWLDRHRSVADYWWVSDDRVVVAAAKGVGMFDQPYLTGELYGIDADSTHQATLFGYEGKPAYGYMVTPMLNEPNEALIKVVQWDQPNLRYFYRMNVMNGKLQLQRAVPATGAAQFYLPEMGSVVDVNAQTRGEPHRAGEAPALAVYSQQRAVPIRLGASEDGRMTYLASAEGSAPVCLRSRNAETGALATLSCNPEFDTSLVPAWSDTRGMPLVAAYETDKFLAQILKPDGPPAKIYKLLEKTFPGQRIRVTSSTQDGSLLLVLVDGGRNPGDYYTLDTKTLHANYLFSRRHWIDPDKMSPVEPIALKARDGQVLHGYVTAPHGAKPEARPMIVIPHGGPYGVRDEWNWQIWPQYFASLGYAVLQVNYRGSGGYGGAFESAGYGQWGGLMQDDITDAVQWAIKSGITQSSRICIMGASWGGYAALMGAEREPDLYRCAISYAGVYDLNLQHDEPNDVQTVFGPAYLDSTFGSSAESLRNNSPVANAGRLKATVLISHGTADERVPFKQAQALRDTLDYLHKSYEWLPLRGEEHGFSLEDSQVTFLRKATDVIVETIGPGVPAASSAK